MCLCICPCLYALSPSLTWWPSSRQKQVGAFAFRIFSRRIFSITKFKIQSCFRDASRPLVDLVYFVFSVCSCMSLVKTRLYNSFVFIAIVFSRCFFSAILTDGKNALFLHILKRSLILLRFTIKENQAYGAIFFGLLIRTTLPQSARDNLGRCKP